MGPFIEMERPGTVGTDRVSSYYGYAGARSVARLLAEKKAELEAMKKELDFGPLDTGSYTRSSATSKPKEPVEPKPLFEPPTAQDKMAADQFVTVIAMKLDENLKDMTGQLLGNMPVALPVQKMQAPSGRNTPF